MRDDAGDGWLLEVAGVSERVGGLAGGGTTQINACQLSLH